MMDARQEEEQGAVGFAAFQRTDGLGGVVRGERQQQLDAVRFLLFFQLCHCVRWGERAAHREVAERLSCEKAAVCVILQPLLPFHRDAFCTPAASSWYSQG
jgi:hypothetical protein